MMILQGQRCGNPQGAVVVPQRLIFYMTLLHFMCLQCVYVWMIWNCLHHAAVVMCTLLSTLLFLPVWSRASPARFISSSSLHQAFISSLAAAVQFSKALHF